MGRISEKRLSLYRRSIESMVDAIVSDWNGTLYADRDDRDMFRAVAMAALKSSVPFHPLKFARLVRAKKQLEKLKNRIYRSDGTRDDDVTREMYRIFNEEAVNGLPIDFVRRQIRKYAEWPETKEKIDAITLAALQDARLSGTNFGILSSAYGGWITAVLEASGYNITPDFLTANSLDELNGRAVGFTLNILGVAEKARRLRAISECYPFALDKAAYIGDQEDDEGCFELVKYPVVSPLATDAFKQKCSKRYNAFAPSHSNECSHYIRSIARA